MKKFAMVSLLSLTLFSAAVHSELRLNDMTTHPEMRASFLSMIDGAVLPAWVRQGGTGAPGKSVMLNGKSWLVLSGCKPHDCVSQRIAVLYSPETHKMLGVYSQVDERADTERLKWLHVSEEMAIAGKALLYAALAGDLDNRAEGSNFNE